jgi:predicted phosphodiesterase
MKILLISDIHGNFPALEAVLDHFTAPFDLILNGGDTTVYGPFPNQAIDWLRNNEVPSILGNTDRKVLTLLKGSTFKKPGKPEKRIMYGYTAAELSRANRRWLQGLPLSREMTSKDVSGGRNGRPDLGMYHGSPADPDEFLFPDTPASRFVELAAVVNQQIITVGHSHTPFHKQVSGVHFINPGSVGRMFDGDPRASCATMEIGNRSVRVDFHRVAYRVEEVVAELRRLRFPSIYQEMYIRGRKLN